MGRSTGTIYTYRKRLEQSFLQQLADKPVVDLARDDVTTWYTNPVRSSGEGVAKQHYRTFDGMFRYATGKAKGLPRSFQPWMKKSPVEIPGAGIKKRTRRKDEVVLTPDEIHVIADEVQIRLDEYVDGPGDFFVFPRHLTGNQPHHPSTFRGHFNDARDDADNPRFKDLTFHGRRHSCTIDTPRAGKDS